MAQFNFNANAAFAKIFNSNSGSYLAISDVQPITDSRMLNLMSETGTVYSVGQRTNGSEILWLQFTSLDGYNRPIKFKIDVPTCETLNLIPGDEINKSQIQGLKAISNGPGREPTTVICLKNNDED